MTAAVVTRAPTVPARRLLAGGAVAGPLFVTAVLAQGMARDGFDFRRHPLSLLSLGASGWVQVTVFVVTGLLVCAAAVGMRRPLRDGVGRRWAPILFWVHGTALVWAGVFPADPMDGFPAGTPAGMPDTISWHAILHSIAPALGGLALTVAAFVFARRFAREGRRGWAVWSIVVAVVYLVLGNAGTVTGDFRLMLAGGAAIWLWASAVCAALAVPEKSLSSQATQPLP